MSRSIHFASKRFATAFGEYGDQVLHLAMTPIGQRLNSDFLGALDIGIIRAFGSGTIQWGDSPRECFFALLSPQETTAADEFVTCAKESGSVVLANSLIEFPAAVDTPQAAWCIAVFTVLLGTDWVRRVNGYPEIGLVRPLAASVETWRRLRKQVESPDDCNKSSAGQPDNPDVRDLCHLLKKNQAKIARGEKTEIGVAREFLDNEAKAQNTLRQARRYPHLWKRADK